MRNHGGLAEILRTKQFPGTKTGWSGGFVSGLAKFPYDPDSYCATKEDVDRKCREQGKVILEDHT